MTHGSDWAIPPGEVLQEWLDERLIDAETFAGWAHMSTENLTRLLSGEMEMNRGLATKLHELTGISVDLWVNLDHLYRLKREEKGKQ